MLLQIETFCIKLKEYCPLSTAGLHSRQQLSNLIVRADRIRRAVGSQLCQRHLVSFHFTSNCKDLWLVQTRAGNLTHKRHAKAHRNHLNVIKNIHFLPALSSASLWLSSDKIRYSVAYDVCSNLLKKKKELKSGKKITFRSWRIFGSLCLEHYREQWKKSHAQINQ